MKTVFTLLLSFMLVEPCFYPLANAETACEGISNMFGGLDECVRVTTGYYMHPGAVALCKQQLFTEKQVWCLYYIRGKRFTPDEIASCSTGFANQQMQCLQDRGR